MFDVDGARELASPPPVWKLACSMARNIVVADVDRNSFDSALDIFARAALISDGPKCGDERF